VLIPGTFPLGSGLPSFTAKMSLFLKAATALALSSTAYAYAEAVHDPTVDCNANTIPAQIRVAYAGARGMAISWNTNQKLAQPTVFYGKDNNDSLDKTAFSTISTTYPTSSTYNNHVTLTNLNSDTLYHYMPQCGTKALTFRTARDAGKGKPFTFAMIGDMGTFGPDGLGTTVGTGASNPLTPGEHTTIDSLVSMKDSYDFIWHGMTLL
jgi:hypothetical protein